MGAAPAAPISFVRNAGNTNIDFLNTVYYNWAVTFGSDVLMANIKDNRRVQYTKTALRTALLGLMLEWPVDRITVKDICAAAGVNRGTFYAHYSSPEQLLGEIENDFYIELLAEVASFHEASDVKRIFTEALRALWDRREIASALFGPNGDRDFLDRVISVAHDMCIVQWSSVSPQVSREYLEYAYAFLSLGVVNALRRWLKSDRGMAPEELAALMTDLCNFGVGGVVDLANIKPPVERTLPGIN